jgi:GT2 family glycosyltransferase
VALVDVVVVSFRSRVHLRACVEPLVRLADTRVIVVDNASDDGSLETVVDLPLTAVALRRNGGFAYGCNVGWRTGDSPFVLFLNPDARLDPSALRVLAEALEADARVGAIGPRLLREDGSLIFSRRHYPRLRSTYARALFLHRLFPRAEWADEPIRDERAYDRAGSAEWISGACMLVRRSALEDVDGLDEGFFLYCEETDLCRRLRDAGWDIRYDPSAVCIHVEGASGPRDSLLPVLAASRVRYARKHRGRVGAALERGGVALEALARVVVSRGGARGAHLRSLGAALRRPASA